MEETPIQSSDSKTNPVKRALTQKQYGRVVLYIFLLVWGAQFAGVIGSVGAVLVIYGIHRVLTSSTYSTKRKWIQSFSYIVAGVLVVFVVRSFVLNTLIERWPNTFLSGPLSNIPYSNQDFASSSTQSFVSSSTPKTAPPATAPQATSTFADVESVPYVDAKTGFSIRYPKDWVINKTQTSSNVEFDDPSPNTVGVETVSADPAKAYTLSTYAKAVMYNFESSAGPNANIKIVNQGSTDLNGQPAYKYELTFDYSQGGQSYPFHGIEIMAINKGIGYYIFASSLEQSWNADLPSLNNSIATFRY